MSLIVQKFGGSSVRDAEHILRAAHIIKSAFDAGNDVIVVVSAQGDTTDELLKKAAPFTPSARELDALLATGEAASAALMAMALAQIGVPAVSLNAWQVPIHTDGSHGNAHVTGIAHERVERELKQHCAVVIAGFQGVDPYGDLTTLGRGGSDTSAAALADAFRADRCRIYTDVDGVYTADPRICPAARHLEEISYTHMRLLAEHGAQVLHGRSVELAAAAGLTLEVLSCEPGSTGTRVTAEADCGEITGVTRLVSDRAVFAAVTIVGRGVPSLKNEKRAILALEERAIEVYAIDVQEDCLTLYVERERADEALCVVHGAFFD